MHFNFPPCCVQSAAGRTPKARTDADAKVSPPLPVEHCCKSAKPQMLNATHKSIPQPTQKSQAKTTVTTATRPQSSSICLPSIMVAHCGITRTRTRAQIQTHPQPEAAPPTRMRVVRWGIANKKGGKSTLLWHLILIFCYSWDSQPVVDGTRGELPPSSSIGR